MTRSFDHVAVLVSDAAAAGRSFERAGFAVAHRENEGEGDYAERRLICFDDDSYLELLSFNHDVPAAQDHAWYHLCSLGEGFADYSIATDDLDQLVMAADGHGLAHTPVVEARRQRIDGTEWAVRGSGFGIFGTPKGGRPEYPFVLEDITERGIRSDGPRRHPNHAIGIHEVTIVTDDPQSAHAGLEFFTGVQRPVSQPHAQGRLWSYAGRALRVALLCPTSGTAAAQRLEAAGPGLFEVTLSTSRGAASSSRRATGDSGAPLAGSLIDPELTHGARFLLAPAPASDS